MPEREELTEDEINARCPFSNFSADSTVDVRIVQIDDAMPDVKKIASIEYNYEYNNYEQTLMSLGWNRTMCILRDQYDQQYNDTRWELM